MNVHKLIFQKIWLFPMGGNTDITMTSNNTVCYCHIELEQSPNWASVFNLKTIMSCWEKTITFFSNNSYDSETW